MTGTAGLNDTTIATSSAAHASTAHGPGDTTPPRGAAPPVVRAGASQSDRTISPSTRDEVRISPLVHARPKRSARPSEGTALPGAPTSETDPIADIRWLNAGGCSARTPCIYPLSKMCDGSD